MTSDRQETPSAVWKQIVRILPEQTYSQGIQIKETISDLRWSMGYWANDVYKIVVGNAMPLTKYQIAAAVSHFFDDARSMSSVILYMSVAEFYPPEIVDAYETLPFSHFEYAMRFGPDWRNVLDYSIDLAGQRGGIPPSVKALESHFEVERMEALHYDTGPDINPVGDIAPADRAPIAADRPSNDYSAPDITYFYRELENRFPGVIAQMPEARPIVDRLESAFRDLLKLLGIEITEGLG
jgi:hypothetical protein